MKEHITPEVGDVFNIIFPEYTVLAAFIAKKNEELDK